MFTRTLIPTFLLLAASLYPPNGHATSFVEQPFEEGVQEAPVIVRGKVGTSYTNWATSTDGIRRIYTFTELALDEVFKGSLGQKRSVILRELGGEKDGVGMQISGTARFERNEDVVVYLNEANPDGSHDVRGMMMGKYEIVRGDDGKEYLSGAGIHETIRPELRGHEHMMEPGHRDNHGDHEGQDGTRPVSKWSIDGLRQLIRTQEVARAGSSPSKKKPSHQAVAAQPTPVLSDAASSPSPAPQLQPSSEEASEGLGSMLLTAGAILVVAGLAVALLLVTLLRRR